MKITPPASTSQEPTEREKTNKLRNRSAKIKITSDSTYGNY